MARTARRTTTGESKAAAESLLSARSPGWSLPGSAYTDPELFAAELVAVFGTGWLFLGASAALPVGSSQVWTVGGESIIVCRDD